MQSSLRRRLAENFYKKGILLLLIRIKESVNILK